MSKRMIGRVLAGVTVSDDKQRIRFDFTEGEPVEYEVEGDCCSSSWIEHLTMPDDVAGATILGVEESGGVPWDEHKCGHGCNHDVLAFYWHKFRTDRGDIVLEYRNDSNGYYGGSIYER